MKTSRKSMMVALMFGTLIGYANVNKASNSDDAITVTNKLYDVKKGNTISVKNKQGNVILSKTIKSNEVFSTSQLLHSLRDGYYTVEVDKDFEVEVSSITIKKGTISFHKNTARVIYKPVFRAEKNKVFISKIAFDTNLLKVAIYYEGTLILSDTVKGNQVLERIYSLSKDVKGDYKVVMKTNDRTYIKTFSL
jgi:hypothetical protein